MANCVKPYFSSMRTKQLPFSAARWPFHQHYYAQLFHAKDKKAACFLKMNFNMLFCTKILYKNFIGQVRLGQVGLGQVRLGQVRLGQVSLGQVRLGQLQFVHGLGEEILEAFLCTAATCKWQPETIFLVVCNPFMNEL